MASVTDLKGMCSPQRTYIKVIAYRATMAMLDLLSYHQHVRMITRRIRVYKLGVALNLLKSSQSRPHSKVDRSRSTFNIVLGLNHNISRKLNNYRGCSDSSGAETPELATCVLYSLWQV